VLNQSHINKILSFEIASFLLVIELSWMSEMTELPHVMGAPEYISSWRESTLETLIVIFVAIPVLVITRRLLSRLHYLDGFLRVCAWCKKLNHNNEWIPLRRFLPREICHADVPRYVLDVRGKASYSDQEGCRFLIN
jgi:hypothetical protein